ncbi:MAG TPA: alpha-galactosidase [Rubrobacter sp.]|nr:alpha-galactosidase [Rubrobacter sp.]
MAKVTLIGAGSAVFARQIVTDVLAIDGLDGGTFALVDIDAERLKLAHDISEKLVEATGKDWTVQSSTERNDVLAGTDFLVNSIEVAGLENVHHDYEIPLRYGVDQCIGDTIGPGGIFKALRTGPAWLEILRDAERECPDAVVMNYTNPMSLLTLAARRATSMNVVGLCHSIQGTSEQLAGYVEVPLEELNFRAAGINHNSWFVGLETNGKDLYPELRERARKPELYERDPVRFETMFHLGAFPTESSGHFSEYLPYFRKRPDLIERYARDGYLGESGYYANNWSAWRAENDEEIRRMLSGEEKLPLERSTEYAADVIEAITLGGEKVVYGNVENTGLIENLPDGCVEVACLVNRNGVQPTHFGALPEQLAALNRAHMAVHELVVQALLERDRQAALYALMLDPLTAAVCSLEEIRNMFDEMWEAQRPFLTSFQ